MSIQKEKYNKKKDEIIHILSGQTLYQKPVLTQSIFNTDLVLKMKFPLSPEEQMIQKNKHARLDEFIYNPNKNLLFAHQLQQSKLNEQTAFKKASIDSKNSSEKSIHVRNQVNFHPLVDDEIIEKSYEAILTNGEKQQVMFPCYVKCSSAIMDCFTLNYNTLIYVLQKQCGFNTTSYFVEEVNKGNKCTYIYILLSQDTEMLLKSADRFRIKKQIDYSQIDLFLNQPVDELLRPYQSNTALHQIQKQILKRITHKKKQEFLKVQKINQINGNQIILKINQTKDRKAKLIVNDHKIKKQQHFYHSKTNNNINKSIKNQKSKKQYQTSIRQEINKINTQFQAINSITQLFKRVHRNMRNKGYKVNQSIINRTSLNESTKQNLTKYFVEFFLQFDEILQEEVQLNTEQQRYILDINRNKINPKCQKEYILKLKRKKLFKLLQQLSKKFKFQTYHPPLAYFPFILPSKRLSFMERLKGVLLYEEYKVSPSGDYSLFFKMDKIKIAYLNLKQHLRVQNLNKINCELFALHDNFQRYGLISQAFYHKQIDPQTKGGINGVNLRDCWHALTPWTVDQITVRNYYGQNTAYQVYLKAHLIFYFLVITPLGIIGEIVNQLFIQSSSHFTQLLERGFSLTHKQQLIFHILFFALTIGFFALFLQIWENKEQVFKDNFVQNQTQSSFRYSYKGPYIRNNITDSVNQHRLTVNTQSLIIKAIGFLLILIILGGECGCFYGLRMLIIKLSKLIPQTNVYLISWPHIIAYGIYFIFNQLLYRFIILRITQFLTQLQNIPTENLHRDSFQGKNSLFSIGIELIPVIFLLIFQPLKRTSCYSSSCYDQFTQYIYSRFVILFIFLGLKVLVFIALYIKTIKKQKINQYNSFCNNFDEKLLSYIQFIQNESQKPEYQLSIDDQTEALLHYGIFSTSFPLSPLISLANMILQYEIQRIEVLVRNRRPISKSQIIQLYSKNFNIIMHLSIFVNIWLIFFTLEQIEYNFQKLIRAFISQYPTYESILTLKICIIAIVITFFEIYVALIRYFTKNTKEKVLNNRKKYKYQKYILERNFIQKCKPTLQKQKIYPFRTIFRTYHRQVAEQTKKISSLLEKQQDQTSAKSLKQKKT